MDIVIIIIFIVVFTLSGWFLTKPSGLPPGPFAFPVVGCISVLKQFKQNRPHLVLHELAKKYGDIMSLRFGQTLLVVLTGYDVIHEALVKQADVFSDRPIGLAFQRLLKDGRGILFQRYGHEWRTMRRFTLQTLRDFGVGKSPIEERIMSEIDAATRVLVATKGKPTNIAPLVYNISGNVIYGIIFGERYDYDDPASKMVKNLASTFISGQGILSPAVFFPQWFLKLMPVNTYEADLTREQTAREINEFLLKKVKEHEDTYDENNIRDFVDLYIQLTRKNDETADDAEHTFTKGNILRTIQDLFFAGTETTAGTLDWALLFMIEHPEIQRTCQLEIEQVVGDKAVAYIDRVKLPFVDATMREIQRLCTIAPHGVAHSTIKDTRLLGYNIPQGTLVLAMLYSVSMDTRYWEKPEKFRPERFLDSEGKLNKMEAHIPFSVGPSYLSGRTFGQNGAVPSICQPDSAVYVSQRKRKCETLFGIKDRTNNQCSCRI